MTQDPHVPPIPHYNRGKFWPMLAAALLITSLGLGAAYQLKAPAQAQYTDAQKARIAEAYVFEHYFCTDNLSEVSHSDAETTVRGLAITSVVHCVQNDGNVQSYEVTFNQTDSTMRICEQGRGICHGENRPEPLGPTAPA